MDEISPLVGQTIRKLGLVRPAHIAIDLDVICHPQFGGRPYAIPLLSALKEKGYVIVILGTNLTFNAISKALGQSKMLELVNAYTNDTTSTEIQWWITASADTYEAHPEGWHIPEWNGSRKDRTLEKYVKHILSIKE